MTEFALAHPYITGLLVYFAISTIRRAVNMVFRSRNIRAHGWPPPHVDADGDPVEKDDE